MDIYSILARKPHNLHYLNRYINFIEQCQLKNVGYTGPTASHHICPQANDMFPEYKDFRYHPWNRVDLTPRQHDIAHLLLWKIYRNKSMTFAWNIMKSGRNRSDEFISDHRKYMSEMGKEKYDNKIACIIEDGSYIRVSKEDFDTGEYFGNCKGKVVVKNKENIVFQVSKEDPRYLSGELVGVTTGMVTVSADGGKSFIHIPKHNYDYNIHVGPSTGKVTVKDKNGNTLHVTLEDSRYLSGELVHIMKGKMNVRVIGTNESIMINCSDYDLTKHIFHTKDKIVVKDQHDNMHQVSLDDTRYISGELVPIHKDIAYGWNSLGEKIKTTTGDIRFKTGELKGNNRDKFWITNGKENAMINKNDSIPDGYYKGRIQKISTNIDMIYINDGNKNIKIPKSESIPEGWSRGMTKGTRKRLIYITDGKINKKIPPEDEIPEGFRAGMAPKKKLK
jgi:hypothetical protein